MRPHHITAPCRSILNLLLCPLNYVVNFQIAVFGILYYCHQHLVALHRRVVEHVLDVAAAGLARRQQLPKVADAVNVLAVYVLELTVLEPKREAPVEERVCVGADYEDVDRARFPVADLLSKGGLRVCQSSQVRR